MHGIILLGAAPCSAVVMYALHSVRLYNGVRRALRSKLSLISGRQRCCRDLRARHDGVNGCVKTCRVMIAPQGIDRPVAPPASHVTQAAAYAASQQLPMPALAPLEQQGSGFHVGQVCTYVSQLEQRLSVWSYDVCMQACSHLANGSAVSMQYRYSPSH